ncbi:MAG: hypothetical protein ACC628_11350 [Pirellulaceae bacterium]
MGFTSQFNLLDRVILTGASGPDVTVVEPSDESGVLITTADETR